MNAMSLQDVNACGIGTQALESEFIKNITENLFPLFEKYAITPFYTLCFGAPAQIDGGTVSGDPLDPITEAWWSNKMSEIYEGMPNLGERAERSGAGGGVGEDQNASRERSELVTISVYGVAGSLRLQLASLTARKPRTRATTKLTFQSHVFPQVEFLSRLTARGTLVQQLSTGRKQMGRTCSGV